MAVEFTAGEDENAARRCIEQAGSRLANVRADIPADFVARLYSRVVPEDVVRYGAADLADLAKQAFDFLEQRTPGAPKIRCETVALKASGESQAVTVIEIVNDDMPFLLDSVMGELADRGVEVRLVAHPVIGVQRDGNKLTMLGTAEAMTDRKSTFIHIHCAPIPDAALRGAIIGELQKVLGEVRLAVQDWQAMRERVTAIVTELKDNPPPLPVDEIGGASQ